MFFIISLICIFQVKKLIGLQNFKAISLLTVDGAIYWNNKESKFNIFSISMIFQGPRLWQIEIFEAA